MKNESLYIRQKNVHLDVSIMLVNMIQLLGFYINYYHSQKSRTIVINNFRLFFKFTTVRNQCLYNLK